MGNLIYGYCQNKGKHMVAQYKSLYAQANTEYEFTFNIKDSVMNWNYDMYKISMYLGEANVYALKDVYVAVGLFDWGDYQAQVIKQVLICEDDFIGDVTVQNNGNGTITIKCTPIISAKLKVKVEPYAIY